jgi:serine/threonine protein kinase/Tfp pilus assembly protein PilF
MPGEFEQLKEIFLAAVEKANAPQREAYLEEACAGDLALRRRVDDLLRQHERAGSFLESPAPALADTVIEPGAGERPGTQVDRYRLLEPLGEGGFGIVFRAEQQQPVRRQVALKVLKPGMDTRQIIGRFEAERQALALMEHPNIARVLDGGETASGRPYFVMELVRGLPVTAYCDQQRLAPRERLDLFVSVCQAVQHAHQKGIIHRDLKPSNVLVTAEGGAPVAKVIDFGVAKALGQRLTDMTVFTGFAQLVGTPLYMSPEQAALAKVDVDTRSDIYSLGVLLYELLTGTTPFDKERLREAGYDELRRIICEEEPPRPSTRLLTPGPAATRVATNRQSDPKRLSQLVRGDLDWIVMKALEKDRGRRYETASALAADVQRFLHDEPVQARPPSAWYKARKFARRNRRPVVAAGVVLLCLVGGIIGTTAGLVWALHERDRKDQALAAEKQARDQALAALRDMTDGIVEQQMARGDTLTEENKAFLRKIIQDFEGFAAITAEDADSRAIRAEGYFRVGTMRARLGEMAGAETAYRDALALQRHLTADFPNRPEFRQNLAKTQNNLGILLCDTGRLAEGETAFRDALALQKQLTTDFPDRAIFRYDMASSGNNLGFLLRRIGRLAEAEAVLRDALAIQKQMTADFPNRPEFRHLLAKGLHGLASLLYDAGRPEEAETAFRDALALQKQLAADFPNRPQFRQELAKNHQGLGVLLSNTSRLAEAETAYRDGLALSKQLAADFPTRPEFRQDLARNHCSLGILFRDGGRLREAETAYRDALTLQRQLVADFPTRPTFRNDLANSHHHLGLLLGRAGRLAEAETAYLDALAVRKQLAAEFPNQPDRRNELAGTLVNFAQLCNQRRHFQSAKACLEEARPLHQAALQANPRHPGYRQDYCNNLLALVQAHAGLRDQAGAVATAERLRDLEWDPPGNAYDAACGLALCIPIVHTDEQAAPDARAKAVQFYGDAAMAMLKAAVARGWKEAAHMKKDTDLDPLRQREDFKVLVAELEAIKKR